MKYLKGILIFVFAFTLAVGTLPQSFVYADDDIKPDEEIVPDDYNPGPSTDRQTNEEVEKVPSTRKATGTKRVEVEEAEVVNANKTIRTESSSSSDNSSSNSSGNSSESSSNNSTSDNSSSVNSSERVQTNTTQEAQKKEDIGDKSMPTKTGRDFNPMPYMIIFTAILGILEVVTVRRLVR